MSGPNASESINEKYVFDLALKPLLAVAKGTSGQIIPVEQARAVDTQYHFDGEHRRFVAHFNAIHIAL